MGHILRKHGRLISFGTVLGALVALLALGVTAPRAAARGASDIDGDWRLTSLVISGQQEVLPEGTLHYTFSAAGGTLDRYWVLNGLVAGPSQESVSATFRGPGSWTSQDISEMEQAGLDPDDISGLFEAYVASGVLARVAYEIVDLGGGQSQANLTRIYQQAPWYVPTTTVYAPRPVGQGQGAIMFQSPAGGRVFDSMTLTK